MTKLVSVCHNGNDEDRMSIIWAHWRDEAINRGITMDAINHIFEQWFEGNITLMVDPHVVYKVHKNRTKSPYLVFTGLKR